MNKFVVWLVAVIVVSVAAAHLLGWFFGWPDDQVKMVAGVSVMATLLTFAGRRGY